MENQNIVHLTGKVVEIKKVWQTNGHTVCEGTLQIIRDSGAIDLIPVLFNDIIIELNSFISVVGQFRSRDIDINGKLKVELYVYAQEVSKIKDICYKNEVFLTGYVCKKPTIRNTPSGKQISDILIACNYNKDKSAYIPVITWGRCARKSGKFIIGTEVKISGRLQSRKYLKEVNGVFEEHIAYELSASSIEIINCDEY